MIYSSPLSAPRLQILGEHIPEPTDCSGSRQRTHVSAQVHRPFTLPFYELDI